MEKSYYVRNKYLLLAAMIGVLMMKGVNAQEGTFNKKGTFLIGGALSLTTSTSDQEVTAGSRKQKFEGLTTTQFDFSPDFGYFIVDNFALGISMGYTIQSVEDSTGTNKDTDVLIGPFARYYFAPTNNSAFFLEATSGFGTSSNDNFGASTNNTVFKIGTGPGFTIVASDIVGIEAIAKYTYSHSTSEFTIDGQEFKNVDDSHGFDFQVGFQLYFTRFLGQ